MSIAIQQKLMIIENSDLSWAITLIGTTPRKVQSILDDFHETKVSHPPTTGRPVLSELLHVSVNSKNLSSGNSARRNKSVYPLILLECLEYMQSTCILAG